MVMGQEPDNSKEMSDSYQLDIHMECIDRLQRYSLFEVARLVSVTPSEVIKFFT